MVFESWKQMQAVLTTLTEEELRESINFEISTYGRVAIISRLHQRYAKLRAARERELLVRKEMLL